MLFNIYYKVLTHVSTRFKVTPLSPFFKFMQKHHNIPYLYFEMYVQLSGCSLETLTPLTLINESVHIDQIYVVTCNILLTSKGYNIYSSRLKIPKAMIVLLSKKRLCSPFLHHVLMTFTSCPSSPWSQGHLLGF